MGKKIKTIIFFIGYFIISFFRALFGTIHWSAPVWIRKVKEKPSRILVIIFILLILFIFTNRIYVWYQSLPTPNYIRIEITSPKLTPINKKLIPDHLKVRFGYFINGEFHNKSVAPLSLIGKEVTKGITLSPQMPGKWYWENDSQLDFTPSQDWPAGQKYYLSFSKNVFTPHTSLREWQTSFRTMPFDALISDFKFYQNPQQPEIRQAVATITFSYPVDVNSLTNHLELFWQTNDVQHQRYKKELIKYTLNYDEHQRRAYLHSENISLPPVGRYLELKLTKGIKPRFGSTEIKEDNTATLYVPDSKSYFKVNQVTSNIVRNLKDQPEQVLHVETSLGVKTEHLMASLHAYLLPKDYPATAWQKEQLDYQWQTPGEVTPLILSKAIPIKVDAIPSELDYNTLHSFKYLAKTPAFLYIEIDPGLVGFGNFTLANPYKTIIKVPDFPEEISFLHKGSLLALGTEEKLSVLVRGLAAVKFNVARVLPDDINHLVSQTWGDFSHPYFLSKNFNQYNLSQLFSHIEQFDMSEPGKTQYTALDLKKYLTNHQEAHPIGLFLLQAEAWDTSKNVSLGVRANRLILMTDLGLIVKDNSDGTHDFFVQSIATGKARTGASVSILGRNGLALFTQTTDTSGHAQFPSLKNYNNEQEPTVYLVRYGSDVSFIPYHRFDRQLNYSRFDVGGITQQLGALNAYLFSDRGIYRPGDTAHIGMIIKRPYVMPEISGVPLQLIITDPKGTTIKEEKIITNESGFYAIDLKTEATSSTGTYLINLYIVKDNHPSSLIGSTSLQVAEFLPDRMRISTTLYPSQTTGWVSPTDLKATVGLWNLYGAPAVDHRISAKILLTPKIIQFKEFPDYIFFDPLFDAHHPPKVLNETLQDTKTNERGHAELDFDLERFVHATYQLTLFVEGFELEGGRSVTTQTSALVSPLPYLIGYKKENDLAYIKQNTERSIHFIAVNPKLHKEALSNLKLQLFKLQPITTLVKKEDGTYEYQSVVHSKKIIAQEFNISEQITDYSLPTHELGDFLLTISDKSNLELTQLKYSVVGNSQQALPKNAELNVKLNQTEFNAGDEIEMQISAPYIGAGLITLERDKVYASQWFKTDSNTSLQKIRIPNDFQANGYVNIAFVRDLNSPEIFMSPLSYSVIPFSVTHQKHAIHLNLSVPDVLRPGEVLPITYQSDQPGKAIIFAVDEGILQVTQYQTPDPLQFFFQKQALNVTTSQIVDQILPKFIAQRELSAVGGDGAAEELLAKHLNPFKRQTDAPVVYWSGIIDVDQTPKQLAYTIPDYFNGRLRVMGVAVANTAVGSADKQTQVRGHFVISPNVPTFVSPNDEFDISASVANNVKGSGNNAKITITISTTPQLKLLAQSKQDIIIPEGEERSIHFRVKATDLLGNAQIEFAAQFKENTSKISSSLSLRPANVYHTDITSGFSQAANLSLNLNRILYPEFRKVEAALSPNPIILLTGIQNYLNVYPYGCTEQLVSKTFPLLVIGNTELLNDHQTVNDKIQQLMQILLERQMSTGGFNYWPGTGSVNSNDFASIYAMHFLTEARERHIDLSQTVFASGIHFLKEFVTQPTQNLEKARLQAYAIYLLTRNEIITTNYLTHLQLSLEQFPKEKWQHDITSAYLAATYQLLKNQQEAQRLIAYYQPQIVEATQTDFYDQNIANAQFLYLLAKHFPEMLFKQTSLIASLANALNNDEINTLLSAYTTLAFSAYQPYSNSQSNTPLSLIESLTNGKQHTLATAQALYQSTPISLYAKQIIFQNPAKQDYFYQLTQSGFDKNFRTQPISHGIEVYRELRNINNESITETKLGDEILVSIRARAIDGQYHDHIAIVDLLPGGFEPVRESINKVNMDYIDVREDRVIFFGGIGSESKEIVYKIKATNQGQFTVAPIFATSMYHSLITSIGKSSTIKVIAP